MLSVGFICSIYTASSIAYFKSIRFVLYFFFLYDIYRSTHFEIYQYLRLLKFLMGLVILQGVASIIQIFIIGERIEGYVGYMSSLGGSTATTFLVLVLSICMVILLYSNNKLSRKYIYEILLCIASAILVGYSTVSAQSISLLLLHLYCLFFYAYLYSSRSLDGTSKKGKIYSHWNCHIISYIHNRGNFNTV